MTIGALDGELIKTLKAYGELSPPVLNVGCGDQLFGDIRIDSAPGSANVLADLQDNLPIRDVSFGTIFSRFFVEHLADVQRHFQEAWRVLKPGGRCFTITDNAGYVPWHLDLARNASRVHRPGGYQGRTPDDRHYCLFTDAHLLNHLRRAGFERPLVAYVDAFQVGSLTTRPFFQALQYRVDRWGGSLGSITRPYLTPHLLAVASKPTAAH